MRHQSNLMTQIIANTVLDQAFKAVYQKRSKSQDPHSDIWEISLRWPHYRAELQQRAVAGTYQLSPVQVFYAEDGRLLTHWCSLDAILLKAISMVLADSVKQQVGSQCLHLKGHGGLRQGARLAHQAAQRHRYVIKADVADFYSSTQHDVLLAIVKRHIEDKRIIHIIQQVLNRCEIHNAEHRLVERGIPMGCALSPLLGALILKSLDATLNRQSVVYMRYMDDWLVFTNSRSVLRRLVKAMHRVMHRLQYKLAYNKTFIGRVARGFDFLGYRFTARGLIGLAQQTIQNFNQRIARLYEQHASCKRVALYITRWRLWCCV